jgi:hypothetical protein
MNFQSVGNFVRKEQQLIVQLKGEQFWSYLENSVGNSLCNWHDEQCSQFTNGFTNRITDGKNSVGNSVGKRWHVIIFLLCFNFFSHGNSLGIYRGNISIGKIPQKFTDENIPSIFPFVFIDFLVVMLVIT